MSFIEQKALEAEESQKLAQAAKAAQWREIQLRAPDLAEFLKAVGKAFGKLKLREVIFNQPEETK